MNIKVADEVWLATSLLHLEKPSREDFSVSEIIDRAKKEKLAGGYRPGLQIHASNHCVATKPPNPARHRMLTETGRGRRRLFKDGDKFHRDRKGGKIHPAPEDLPAKYRYLVDWYERDFVHRNGDEDPLPPPGKLADLLKCVGRISSSDRKKMEAAIEEHCGRINPDAW
jgi:hypothetical protein